MLIFLKTDLPLLPLFLTHSSLLSLTHVHISLKKRLTAKEAWPPTTEDKPDPRRNTKLQQSHTLYHFTYSAEASCLEESSAALAAVSPLCSCAADAEVACPCSSAAAVPVLSFSPEAAAADSASGAAAAEAAVVVVTAPAVSPAVVAVVAALAASAAAAGADVVGVESSGFVLEVSKNRNSHTQVWDNLTI